MTDVCDVSTIHLIRRLERTLPPFWRSNRDGMTGYVLSSEIVFWTGSTKHSLVRNAESPSESRRLHEQELKRITDPVPVATKPNAPFSEPKKQASGCKPHQVTSIQLASLVWNSDMHCIFEIVEDHLIIPFIAMDVELTSPWLMTLQEASPRNQERLIPTLQTS